MLSNNKAVNALIKQLVSEGFVVNNHNRHIKLRYSDTGKVVSISKTPSDGRWYQNVMKDVRAAKML